MKCIIAYNACIRQQPRLAAFLLGENMSGMKDILSKAKAAKEARKSKDMGKKGKNFDKIADKAGKEYGSKEAGEKVAGALFQKMRKAGKL
jgi:hypothetical protein